MKGIVQGYLAKSEELKAQHGDDYDQTALTYTVNKAELAVVDAWLKSLLPEILALQQPQFGNSDLVPDGEPYYGAIGGGVTYSFMSTGLGVIITVKESITGKTLNVSDALDWHFFG